MRRERNFARVGALVLGLGLVAGGPLRAAYDGRGRIGVQVDYSIPTGTASVPMTGGSPAFAPQGSQDGNLYGLGLFYEWRIGSASTYSLRRLSMLPSIAVRMGTDQKDSQSFPTLGAQVGGQAVSLTDGSQSRTTKMTETTVALPFRYYPGDGGSQGEGFFVEAGPQLVHTSQQVSLSTTGNQTTVDASGNSTTNGVASSSAANHSKDRIGWTGGFGGVFGLGETSHMAIGLVLSQVAGTDNLPTKAVRGFVQFSF